MPELQLLSNGSFHVMVTASGHGSSCWEGLAVTRWCADTMLNFGGTRCYVSDHAAPASGSIGAQRNPLPNGASGHDFRDGRAIRAPTHHIPRSFIVITLLPNLPDNTIGLAASGRVSGSDYEEVLIPAVEAALKKHKKLRLIYELGRDFLGFAPGAMWDDMKLGMAHLNAWERVAVVTDVSWVANAMNMFKFVMPCTVKVFSLEDRAAAETWIAA